MGIKAMLSEMSTERKDTEYLTSNKPYIINIEQTRNKRQFQELSWEILNIYSSKIFIQAR